MAELDKLLAEIERQVDAVQVAAAHEQMAHLLATIGEQELPVWEIDLRRTIDHFLPKRRKALTLLLERRLQRLPLESPVSVVGAHADLADLFPILEAELATLSNYHIFQWATFYRDSLAVLFDQLFDACRVLDGTLYDELRPVEAAFQHHSQEIFRKGYSFFTKANATPPDMAISKGLNGLQRFLDLPLEFYSTRVHAPRDGRDGAALRGLLSAMLTGVVVGFASVEFERQGKGAQAMTTWPSQWAHVLPFLRFNGFKTLQGVFDNNAFAVTAQAALGPLAIALDRIVFEGPDGTTLPALSFYNGSQRRFEVSLSAAIPGSVARNLDVVIYLDPGQVTRPALQEASRSGVALVLAPLRPDLQSAVQNDERLSQLVVDWSETATATKRTKDLLDYALYRQRSARLAAQPLLYNFANDFPLHNPFLTRYVHVHRSSVRELARTFERRNGVRVWCSVRRSGKTTSCIDLGSSGSDSTFVIQTCAATNQIPDGTRFYHGLLSALESERQLPSNFFAQAVYECVGEGRGATRSVFVLDEYETLFGRLRAAARHDDTLRYTIVQPLLDQMVAFTQDNLLVFLGQQPTAHYVFMEQNQLSAYVEQDSFPLFRRNYGDVTEDEFSQLDSTGVCRTSRF